MQDALITIATRHQAHLERLKAHEAALFNEYLMQIDKDIKQALLSVSSEYTTKTLLRMLKVVGVALDKSFSEYEKVWLKSVEDIAIYEADFELRSLRKVIDGVSFSVPADAVIVAAVFAAPLGDIGGIYSGEMLKPLLKAFTKNERERIQRIINLGFAQGKTAWQINKEIRGTGKAHYKDGELARVRRNQESLTRTALQHASSQARNAVWENNKEVVKRVRISATLDSKTSSICRGLDGMIFEIGKGVRPPFHIRCRTTTVSVLAEKYQFLREGRTRAARNLDTDKSIQVDAKLTYYGWLKAQPPMVQDSIIGINRGKLLRNGGLTVEKFTALQMNKINYKPIALKEMRKIDPIAFENAGL